MPRLCIPTPRDGPRRCTVVWSQPNSSTTETSLSMGPWYACTNMILVSAVGSPSLPPKIGVSKLRVHDRDCGSLDLFVLPWGRHASTPWTRRRSLRDGTPCRVAEAEVSTNSDGVEWQPHQRPGVLVVSSPVLVWYTTAVLTEWSPFLCRWPQHADDLLEDMGLPVMRSGGNALTWPFKVVDLSEIKNLKEERDARRAQRSAHR